MQLQYWSSPLSLADIIRNNSSHCSFSYSPVFNISFEFSAEFWYHLYFEADLKILGETKESISGFINGQLEGQKRKQIKANSKM